MTDGQAVLAGSYRIGKARKDVFDAQIGTSMRIVGKVVGFDADTSTVSIESGDEIEPVTSYSATVLVQI